MNHMKKDVIAVKPKGQREPLATAALDHHHTSSYYRELQRRESVTYKVQQALEGHLEYLEAQLELIRTFGGVTKVTEDDDDDDDDDSLRAEVETLAEDERSIYNEMEALMESWHNNNSNIDYTEIIKQQQQQHWMRYETEETVTATFSEASSHEDQFFFNDEDEEETSSSFSRNKAQPKQIIRLIPPSPHRERIVVEQQEELVVTKERTKVLGEADQEKPRKGEHKDASGLPSLLLQRPKRRTSVTFKEDAVMDSTTAAGEHNNSPHIANDNNMNKVVLDLTPLKNRHREPKEHVSDGAKLTIAAENDMNDPTATSNDDDDENDDISILEKLEILVESLRSLSPEEFLQEFDDDRSVEGGDVPPLLLETKEQRMNYLIDLLSTKAQDMYIQGEGLNFVYASVWLAARIHAQRKPLAGTTMLPCWFRRVLQTLRENNNRKQRSWALAPTIGSASADGQHFMPLCDSDDYHEQDAMLSDLEEWDENDEEE